MEEALGEVLDRAPGRKQHLLSTTEIPKADNFVVDVVVVVIVDVVVVVTLLAVAYHTILSYHQ